MKFETGTVVYIVLDIILALLVIFGNILVCCVIVYSTTLRRKAMYMFVTSLALADIFVGMTAIPFGILTKLGLPYNSTLCIIMLSFIMISTQISIFNMTAISIERFIAIRHPRFHFTKLTPTTSFRIIVGTWLLSILVGLLPVLGWNNLYPQSDNENDWTTTSSNHLVNISTTTRSTDVSTIKSMTSVSNDSLIPASLTSPGSANHDKCIFAEIMDTNYMFFNFIVCVLPPVFICAALYFIIFLSLTRSKNPSVNLNKYNYKPSRSEIISSRSSFDFQYEKPSNSSNKNQSDTNMYIKGSTEIEMTTLKKTSNQNGNGLDVVAQDTTAKNGSPFYLSDSDVANGKRESKLLSREENTKNKLTSSNYFRSVDDESGKQLDPSLSHVGRTTSESIANWEVPHRHNYRHIKTRKEVRAAGVLGMIILAFVVCWLPIHVINTIKRFNEEKFNTFDDWLIDVAILLSHANSAVNFFLYSWRLKAFRTQLRRMMARRALCIRWYKHR